MPWSNKGGGGWQSGGGGDGGGPWGQRPGGSGGGGGGGRQTPPDIEDLLKKGQDKLKEIIPGGGAGGGAGSNKFVWILALVALAGIWAMNAVYTVGPDEEGVVLRLGKYHRTTAPGLHFIMWPVETVETPRVRAVNQTNLGGAGNSTEGLMLAGDQNIVDIHFSVQWRISDPEKYLFKITEPAQLVGTVAESAMREIVGRTNADLIRTSGRNEAIASVQELIQKTLDSYDSGILITGVQLEKADPPPAVIDAFEEVQRAEQDQNKFVREAEQYRNKVLGEKRGEAARIVEEAKGYKARITAEAEGEAERFKSIYAEYSKAKDVTRKRLFLETMEGVLSGSNKVIIEGGQGGSGVVPYLPLPEVNKRRETGGDK